MPEILLGSGYAHQEYRQGFEASIVAAFSLALLQELNGRNAANPISYFMAEKRYPDVNEKIRADLHVDLSKLFSGSESYSNYGFRFSNWIEAKYFRVTNGTPPNTQNLGSIVADLIRLVALVPKESVFNTDNKTRTGRYFLHIYQGDPFEKKLVIATRADRSERKWIKKLVSPGSQEIDDLELHAESKWTSFFTNIPKAFESARCRLSITNYVLKPTDVSKNDHYTMVLTRIDSAEFAWDNKKITFNHDRTFVFEGGDYNEYRKKVSSELKPKKIVQKKKVNNAYEHV